MDHGLKTWQAYGGPKSCLVRNVPRFAEDIVTLYSSADCAQAMHAGTDTPEAYRAWLARDEQSGRNIHFAILAKGAFAGTISLDGVMPGRTAEMCRFATLADAHRPYALAAEFLCLSYALDVLNCRSVWCTVGASRPQVLEFHLKNGWRRCPHFDRPSKQDAEGRVLGLRFGREDWDPAMQDCEDLLTRLTGQPPEHWCVSDIPSALADAS